MDVSEYHYLNDKPFQRNAIKSVILSDSKEDFPCLFSVKIKEYS